MGMFDTFRVVDRTDTRWQNGEGKVLENLALQSKDFANEMNTYYIYGEQVYENLRRDDKGNNELFIEGTKQGDSCLIRTLAYEKSKITGRGRLYVQDKITKPVLALVPNDGWNGNIAELWAWCEWDVDFEDGKLIKLAQVKAPTRDDLFKEVKESFKKHLLPDDHPVAAKHFWDLGFR